jgi:hypothetical protein
VNRQTLVIVLIGSTLLVGAVATLTLMRPQPEAPKAVAKAEPPAPRPVVREAPKEEPPPAPEPARRTARRAPEPNVEPAPEPAPVAPVEAAPEVGVLHIDSDVPGARVFIDRIYVGVTPMTAPDVKPGTHQLNVSVKGYDSIADTIDVAVGPRDIQFKFKEVRLDAKIDVVHKHRIGSCKGRLVATPQGLRYETTDKDDAFTSGLLDLETFQVDYLAKNLSVKPRKGKRYDFTDPDGNADRLFVFQRDVDKARDRLKQGDTPAGQ